jgi:hypothetical protein
MRQIIVTKYGIGEDPNAPQQETLSCIGVTRLKDRWRFELPGRITRTIPAANIDVEEILPDGTLKAL